MVYFLGRDVKLAITTEHAALGIEIDSSDDAVVSGVVGNLLADADLIKNREWPNDGDFDETVDDFDNVAVTESLTNVSVSAITKTDDTASFTLTITGNPTADETIAITNADNSTITLTAHASSTSGTNFWRGGSNATVTDSIQTAFEANDTNGKFTLTQPTSTTILFTTTQDRDLGIVLSGDEKNVLDDVVGIDLATDTVDEDINYFGQRTGLKAQIKKATTISITRKRSSNDFNTLFQQARGGVATFSTSSQNIQNVDNVTGATDTAGVTANLAAISNHTYQPDRNYGYRVHLMLKEDEEVLTLKNCCFQEYSVTLGADSVQEETLVFYSMVEPVVAAAGTTAVTAASDF
tara:strand:- start:1573 stop:2625 length:1053 start_codon:yes stop_codon:yes gene_type:complete